MEWGIQLQQMQRLIVCGKSTRIKEFYSLIVLAIVSHDCRIELESIIIKHNYSHAVCVRVL